MHNQNKSLISNVNLVIAGIIIILLVENCFVPKRQKYVLDQNTVNELHSLLNFTEGRIYPLSSHRGGPEPNFPENCIETFNHTIKNAYSLIECDPRYTKDSFIVLHHDRTLSRTTTGHGLVSDYTLEQIRQLKLIDMQGNITPYVIPTLDEALIWAKENTILVLDKKDVPVEERLRKISEHNAEANAILMAYSFEEAKHCYDLNNKIMMQVFINSPEKLKKFEEYGVPWKNVVVFVGHKEPENLEIFELIHEKGSLCIMGTSRNLDRKYIDGEVAEIKELKKAYLKLLDKGVDIIETDIPVPLSQIISQKHLDRFLKFSR